MDVVHKFSLNNEFVFREFPNVRKFPLVRGCMKWAFLRPIVARLQKVAKVDREIWRSLVEAHVQQWATTG